MEQTITFTTNSVADTEDLGSKIGGALSGGEIIELISDLGGGKTTITRGIVRGSGSTSVVASPTFTISKVYQAQGFSIHHYDLYRLNEPGIMMHELQELFDDRSVVTIVEWPDIARSLLPPNRITVELTPVSEFQRRVTIKGPDEIMKRIKDNQ